MRLPPRPTSRFRYNGLTRADLISISETKPISAAEMPGDFQRIVAREGSQVLPSFSVRIPRLLLLEIFILLLSAWSIQISPRTVKQSIPFALTQRIAQPQGNEAS